MYSEKMFLMLTFTMTNLSIILCGCTKSEICTVWCIHESPKNVVEFTETIWEQMPETCHASGMKLILYKMFYPNKVISKGWFTANVSVNDLEISLDEVDEIQINAFDSVAFHSVTKLLIQQMNLKFIENGIFSGLVSVETLRINVASVVKFVEAGILNVLNNTLKEFYISQHTNVVIECGFELDPFTGSDVLLQLGQMKISLPLCDKITSETFTGIRNIVTLDLSNCQINAIGERSFDLLGSLAVLKLNNNSITTLPAGLFNGILSNVGLKIFLSENPFVCDCFLKDFQNALQNFTNFDDSLLCNTPADNFNEPVKQTLLKCDPIYNEDGDENEDEENIYDVIIKNCTRSDYSEDPHSVHILQSSASFSLKETDTGDLLVSVEKPKTNLVLIWYAVTDRDKTNENMEINCIYGQDVMTIKSSLLSEHVIYTVCFIEEGIQTVSPFNCASYAKRNHVHGQVWLLKSRQLLVISVTIVGFIACLVVGTVITLCTSKLFQTQLNCYVRNARSSKHFDQETKMKSQKRTSTCSNSTTSEKLFEQQTVPLPPLPPLPERLKPYQILSEPEPVYSYIAAKL